MYDAYAPIYDATGQGRFGAYLASLALAWLAARGVTPRRALDLACGTGGSTLALAEAGLRVTGVDRSEAMLAIASGRARDAGLDITFGSADLRALDVARLGEVPGGERIDLVTCFGDAVNYLVEDGDLERLFAAVAGLLARGGHLAFDVNTEAAFGAWDERDVVTYDGPDCLVYNRLDYVRAMRRGTGRIVWFVRSDDDRWWRGEETHVERAWSDAELRSALGAAGLAVLARLDPRGAQATEATPRAVYLVQHPA